MARMTRALVTGANGHVGAHLVRELLANDYQVVAFVRETSDLRGLDGLDVELRYGDVMNRDTLVAGAEGCDVMFHTAAVYKTWAKDPQDVMEPAVAGSRNAIAAAVTHGIRRVVYTSSIVAIGYTRSPDELRSETDWNDDAANVYFRAKTDSEREARRLAEADGIELVSVCPAVVLGAHDYRVTPSTRIVRDLIDRTGFTFKGGLNIVSAADVARVHRLAAEQGAIGGRYIAAGANLHMRELGALVTELTGIRTKHAPFPRWFQFVVGFFMELGAKLTGKPPMGTRDLVRDAVERYGFFDISATRALGFEPEPVEDTLRETVSWLLHIGALKPKVAAKLRERFPASPAWKQLPAPSA